MQPVLLVVQFILAVALVAVILLQRTAQDGGGLMGGGNTMGGLFTARGSANLLTRATSILATLFIVNSLGLGFIASHEHQAHDIADQIAPIAPAATQTEPAVPGPATTPAVPAAPAAPSAKAPSSAPKKAAPAKAPEVPLAH